MKRMKIRVKIRYFHVFDKENTGKTYKTRDISYCFVTCSYCFLTQNSQNSQKLNIKKINVENKNL